MDRLYCTIADMIADIDPTKGGDETAWMRHIGTASQFIEMQLNGNFIPRAFTNTVTGSNERQMRLPIPLLEVTGTIMNWNTPLSTADWVLEPSDRMWQYGPYTFLERATLAPHMTIWFGDPIINGISIPGLWGLYERAIDLGITVQNPTKQAAADTTIIVADGSKLSPGMTLFLDNNEQELITSTGAASSSGATLASAAANTDDAITPSNVAAANIGETIQIDFEKMMIADKSATQWSVYRGWNNTAKATHSTSTAIAVFRTFAVQRSMNGTTAADHTNGVEIYRYVPPDDVRQLCQMTAGMVKKLAESKFAGRSGDAQLGQVFYNDPYPRDYLAQLQKEYEID